MAYKFQVGEARLSGSLVREGDVIFKDSSAASNIVMEVDEDGDVKISQHDGSSTGLMLGSTLVTSTAAELNLVDGSSVGAVVNSKAVIYSAAGIVQATDFKGPDGFGISNATVSDFMLFNAAAVVVKDGAFDFDVASHDAGTNGLKLGGTLVEASAIELNLLDAAAGNSVVNDRAVIYGGAGQVAATTISASTGITGSSLQMGAYGLANDGGLAVAKFNSNWTNAGRTVADLGVVSTVDINGGSVDGTIIGAAAVAAGSFAAIVGSSLSVGDGDITNVGDIALDSISADGTQIEIEMTDNTSEAFNISEASTDYLSFDTTNGSELITIGVGWTAGSQTCTDLGSVTTVDINGGSIDGAIIGAAAVAAGSFAAVVGTTATFSSTLAANGDVDLGNATSDTITATGRFDSALVPSSDSARDLGTSALRWSTIYVDSIVGADIAADTEKYGAVPLGYTLSSSVDFALLSTATQTYTLPAASAGKKLDIKLSGSIHTCTIVAASNDSIEGGETIILESTGSAISLVAMDATHWFIV